MDFSIPWHAEVLLYAWMYPKEEISCDYNDTEIGSIVIQLNINNDCGVGSTLKQLKELEKYSFRFGFENHVNHHFTNEQMVNITNCWL